MKKIALFMFILLISVSIIGCSSQGTEQPATPDSVKTEEVYINSQYSFNFTLPLTWEGYSILNSEWEGVILVGEKIEYKGPIISIRNPKWTEKEPYQDIPIMVFTIEQWDALENGVFAIGAAPIGPTELGDNDKYVFALPARYNFAFPTGFEEVDEIINSDPLMAVNQE